MRITACGDSGFGVLHLLRHAELVSVSMAGPLLLRRLSGEGRPWTLKQVQGDEREKLCRNRIPTDHGCFNKLGTNGKG